MKIASILILLLGLTFAVCAQTANTYELVYASAPWNKSSGKIDTAFLFVRDKDSGKIFKVRLQESEPDSSIFSGKYSFSSEEKFSPEVFIPPKELRDNEAAVQSFSQLLKDQKIEAQPLLIRSPKDSLKKMDVFDTEEQRRRAEKTFAEEARLQNEAKVAKKSLKKSLPEERLAEVTKMVERKEQLAKLAKEAADREAERIRQEQIARQKALETQNALEKMAEPSRQKRIRLARRYAEKAYAKYQENDFVAAEDLYKKATDLDPEFKDYFLFYAIALYRNKKFNESLLALRLAEDKEVENVEINYYRGLIHYRLDEFEPARQEFRQVRKAKDHELSPSAAFYQGLINFSLDDYQRAKKDFEFVIDHSKDPNLDNKAEEYLERIAKQIQYQKAQSRRGRVNIQIGANYDSNILFSSDTESSQGSTTDDDKKGGMRALLTGTGAYKAVNRKDQTWTPTFTTYYLYSQDEEFNRADPWLNTLAFPYTWQGVKNDTGYSYTVSPGYEVLFMDANDEGTRPNILNSALLDITLTYVMRPTWIAIYEINYRNDDSRLAESIGPDDADANKYELATEHYFYQDKSQKNAFSAGLSAVLNDAKGDDKKYRRVELGFSYSTPAWGSTWTTDLTAYNLVYPDHSENRKDTNVSLTMNWTKEFAQYWSWSFEAAYSNNTSTVDANQYNQHQGTLSVIYDWP